MTKKKSDHQDSLGHFLEVVRDSGVRLTDSRRDIVEILHAARIPQSAYQLRDTLSQKTGKDIKPVTIYRALDALCEAGLIVKIESENSFTLCHHMGHAHQHAFLVCKKCGTIAEVADHIAGKALVISAEKLGFQVSRQVIELHGLCSWCHS